ncbi:MAG: nucleotidyl transferase AbiEii/AbiGii toxin family protein [Chloroflexota bacterium]
MKIFWNTISPQMRRVMGVFSGSEIGSSFYLAGGTALALQLGHRQSFDLDFFSPAEDIPSIRQSLLLALKPFDPILADSSWGNVVLLAGSVRVGFYGYGYAMVNPLVNIEGFRLAGIADIGLMKLDALLSRASRKDFHDLYAICQNLSLRQLLNLAPNKYPGTRDFESQVVKRLVYFERADREAPLPTIKEVSWETVKAFFRQQAAELGKNWLR